ncbi:MAG: GIY-YIG nuclease family protein [Gemmatimonadota bacterium]|nr:GIY-YIG nuclease family protein [Gemmatimonadota bacterium]
MIEGRTLELFFIDGSPDGMLTAEVFNWTGHFLVTPRTQIKEALKRKEARHAGVYILLGDKDGQPLAYVGEGEDIGERIKNHDKRREWWDKAIMVTSTANTLNKAHIKYLEARLILEAHAARKIKLENGTTPEPGGLSEAAISNMEVFLDNVLLVLPALNVGYFSNNIRSESSELISEDAAVKFELKSTRHNIIAKATLLDNEFIVEKGSGARYKWEGKGDWKSTYRKLHSELIESNVLVPQAAGNTEYRIFQMNYAFRSPSAAAAVVLGRSAGSRNWKLHGTDKPYGKWEEEQLIGSAE